MSTRKDDVSPSRALGSARPTARDVPIAKYKEGGVGTSPPRGLRGESLQPGQGAPERINPDEVELAVLREPDTLDAPRLVRARARLSARSLSNSPPPTPVSVEVPRVRSMPPQFESVVPSPLTPSARSVQSGTLMSIGSIDPRAPTELSLPSPRSLSQSERAAYLAPPPAVGRSPVSNAPSAPVDLGEFVRNREAAPSTEPPAEQPSRASVQEAKAGSIAPPRSTAAASQAVSEAPRARKFGRPAESYSPVAGGRLDFAPEPVFAPPRPNSAPPISAGQQFQIHADLDALRGQILDDQFDLRSVATQREPLASRKAMPSSDWTPTPPSARTTDSARPPPSVHIPRSVRTTVPAGHDPTLTERSVHYPSSSSAITILVEPSEAPNPRVNTAIARGFSPPQRAPRSLGWLLSLAAFALLLALGIAWAVRQPALPETSLASDRGRAEPAAALGTMPPLLLAPMLPASSSTAAVAQSARPSAVGSTQHPKTPSSASPAPLASSTAPRPSAAGSVRAVDAHDAPAPRAQPTAKARQSIY